MGHFLNMPATRETTVSINILAGARAKEKAAEEAKDRGPVSLMERGSDETASLA